MNDDFKHYHEYVHVGDYFDWVNGPNKPSGPRNVLLGTFSSSMLLSYSHPFRNGHWDGGGPFISAKSHREYGVSSPISVFRPGWGKAYTGGFTIATPAQWGVNLGDAYTNNAYTDLKNNGSKMWNRLRPDKPDFSAAVSLYELKDLPGMFKDAVNGFRKHVLREQVRRRSKGRSGLSKTGQFYLAAQFGWIPLLRDIQNFAKAHQNKQKRLRQLIRDAGKPVRRTSTMEETTDHSVASSTRYDSGSGANIDPGFVTQCYGPGPSYRSIYHTTYRKTWGEAVFRYYLPPGPRDVVWTKKMLRRIMGGRVTPDVLYQAMPWSWLVDYFVDLGSFIQAVSPGVADRLAADYSFIMRTERWTATMEGSGMFQGDMAFGHYVSTSVTSAHHSVRKMRSYGSPFGWGINQNSLSPKQWAILGALGLSKLP